MAQKTNVTANQLAGQITDSDLIASRRTAIAGEFADMTVDAVANPSPDPAPQPSQPIPQGPTLQQVRAGDLITAQYVNNLVLAIENLRTRVGNLEELAQGSDSAAAAA